MIKPNAVIFQLTDRATTDENFPHPAAELTRFFQKGLTGNWVAKNIPTEPTDSNNPFYVGLAYNGMIVARGIVEQVFPNVEGNRVLVSCRDVQYHGKPYTYESANPHFSGHQNPVKYAVYDPQTNTFNPNTRPVWMFDDSK